MNLARIFPSLVKALGWTVNEVDYGSSMPASLTSYDHDTQSWKTSERLLTGDLIEYSGALPKSGMMRNGRIYALLISERPIGGKESGLWRTPNSGENGGGEYQDPEKIKIRWERGHQVNLADQVKMWPTPTCNMVSGGPNHNSPQVIAGNHGINLHGAVLKQQSMWPTPTKHNAQETGAPSQMDRNTVQLGDLVGGQLNPTWVEGLMGYPFGWTDLT